MGGDESLDLDFFPTLQSSLEALSSSSFSAAPAVFFQLVQYGVCLRRQRLDRLVPGGAGKLVAEREIDDGAQNNHFDSGAFFSRPCFPISPHLSLARAFPCPSASRSCASRQWISSSGGGLAVLVEREAAVERERERERARTISLLKLARCVARGREREREHWSEREERRRFKGDDDLGLISPPPSSSNFSSSRTQLTRRLQNHLQQQNSLSSSRPASPPSTAALPPRNPPLRARGAQEEPRAAAAAGLLPLRPSPEPAAASPTRTRRCTPSTTSTRSCSSERKGSRGHGRG